MTLMFIKFPKGSLDASTSQCFHCDLCFCKGHRLTAAAALGNVNLKVTVLQRTRIRFKK